MPSTKLTIGILAYQGDVIEHISATQQAARNKPFNIEVIQVRTKKELGQVKGLIIPGGESTTIYKLCKRNGIWEDMKKLRYILGTCAGAIMLAKTVLNKTEDQKTLELMDITIDRNAYGRQSESFEKELQTSVGSLNAVFIRAPKIKKTREGVRIIATDGKEIVACEQNKGSNFYLATCFHPELTSSLFHEYFISKIRFS